MPFKLSLLQLQNLVKDIPHNDTHFVMLNTPVSLSLEFPGDSALSLLRYLNSVIEALCKTEILEKNASCLIQHAYSELLNSQKITNADQLKKFIQKNCTPESRNTCYFTSGWVQRIKDKELSGHLVVIKCVKMPNEQFDFCILNKGAGAQFHQPLQSNKRSYRSSTFRFDLDSPLATQMLSGLCYLNSPAVALMAELQGKQMRSHANLLYHLISLGEFVDTPLESKHATTVQRTGTCTLSSSKLIVDDILQTHFNYTSDQIKKVMLGIRGLSLLAAANQGMLNPSCLQDGLHNFDVTTLKLYPEHLTEPEYHCAISIRKIVSNKILQAKTASHQAILESKRPPFTLVYQGEQRKKENPVVTRSDLKLTCWKQDTNSSQQEKSKINLNLSELLDSFRALGAACASENCDVQQLLGFFRALPIPTGESDDPFYDQLNSSDRHALLEILYRFSILTFLDKLDAQYRLEVLLTIYHIFSQLAEKDPDLNFNGEYTLQLNTDHFFNVQHPNIESHYFTKRLVDAILKRTSKRKAILGAHFTMADDCPTLEYLKKHWLVGYQKSVIVNDYFEQNPKEKYPSNEDLIYFTLINLSKTKLHWLIKLSSLIHTCPNNSNYYGYGKNYDVFIVSDSYYSAALNHIVQLGRPIKNSLFSRGPDHSFLQFLSHMPAAFPKDAHYFDWSENILLGPNDDTNSWHEEYPYFKRGGCIFSPKDRYNLHLDKLNPQLYASLLVNSTDRVLRALSFAIHFITTTTEPNKFSDLILLMKAQLYAYGSLDHSFIYHPETTLELISTFFQKIYHYQFTPGIFKCLVSFAQFQKELYQNLKKAKLIYGLPLERFDWPDLVYRLKQCIKLPSYEKYVEISALDICILDCTKQYPANREDTLELLFYVLMRATLVADSEKIQTATVYTYYYLSFQKPSPAKIETALVNQDHFQYLQKLSPADLASALSEWGATYPRLSRFIGWQYFEGKLTSIDGKSACDFSKGGRIVNNNGNDLVKDFKRIIKNTIGEQYLNQVEIREDRSRNQYSDDLVTSDGQYTFQDKQLYALLNVMGQSFKCAFSKIDNQNNVVVWENVDAKITITTEYQTRIIKSLNLASANLSISCHLDIDANEYAIQAELESKLSAQWQIYLKQLLRQPNWLVLSSFTNGECHVTTLCHKTLPLSFKLVNGAFYSNEYPEYKLSFNPYVAFEGQLPVITLEHPKHARILIMAFQEFSVEHASLRAWPFKETQDPKLYFVYGFDKTDQLISDDIHAIFYLAYVARAFGDYDAALHYLNASHYWQNNDELIRDIYTTGSYHFLDASPRGLAFDLQAYYRASCHQNKMTEKHNEIRLSSLEDKSADSYKMQSRKRKYQASLSQHKSQVSLIPVALQLHEEQLKDHSNGKVDHSFVQSLTIDDKLIEHMLSDRVHHINFEKQSEANKWINEQIIKASNLSSPICLPSIFDEKSSRDIYILFPIYLRVISNKDPIQLTLCLSNILVLVTNYLHTRLFEGITPEYLLCHLLYAHQTGYRLPASMSDTDNCDLFANFNYYHRNKTLFSPFTFKQNAPLNAKQIIKKPISSPAVLNWPLLINLTVPSVQLHKYLNSYFTSEMIPLAQGAFPLQSSMKPGCETIILERLQTGHANNTKKFRPFYSLQEKVSAIQVYNALNAELDRQKSSLATLVSKLLSLISPMQYPQADLVTQLQESGTLQRLSLESCVQAIRHQSLQVIAENLPFINQQQADKLVSCIYDYMLTVCLCDQLNEALSIFTGDTLEAYQQHQVAVILAKKRSYDVVSDSIVFCYEFATGRILRAEQIQAIQSTHASITDAIEKKTRSHGLLEFDAGGGKGEVITPLLVEKQLATKANLLPVVMLTPALYSQGVHVLQLRLQNVLKRQIEVIQEGLDVRFYSGHLSEIHTTLEMWRRQKRCLILQPETWHAINLTRKIAYCEGNVELAQAAEKVLRFFKEQCIKIEDEAHINSDSIEETMISFGKKTPISIMEFELLLIIYECFMAYKMPEYQRLANKVKLTSGSKEYLSDDSLLLVQQQLIYLIYNCSLMQSIRNDDLHTYLKVFHRKDPDWLNKLKNKNKPLADTVKLAHKFIHELLKHILSLQLGKDYGVSIHPHDYLTAPKADGVDVKTHYSSLELVAALTIQRYWQQGLTENECQLLLQDFCIKINDEAQWNFSGILISKNEFDSYMPEGHPLLFVPKLTPDDCKNSHYCSLLQRHYPFIKIFLLTFVFKQLQIANQRVSSSPADFDDGFNLSIKLTATAGLKESYPIYLDPKKFSSNQDFEALVISTLLNQRNNQVSILTADSPLRQQCQKQLAGISAYIDRGAHYANVPASTVIQSLQETFQAPNRAYLFYKDNELLFQSGQHRIVVRAASLAKDLQAKGLSLNQFSTLLFLDLAHSTGVDVKLHYQAQALLTVAKQQTLTQTIQASMRMRQLLELNGQSIIWVMLDGFYKELFPGQQGQMQLPELFQWMLGNEAQESIVKVMLCARQGIYYLIEKHIFSLISADSKLLKQFHQALTTSHWQKVDEEKADHRDVNHYLKSITQQLLDSFNIKLAHLPQESQELIAAIISRTAAILPNQSIMQNSVNFSAQEHSNHLHQEEKSTHKQKVEALTKSNDNPYRSTKSFTYSVEKYGVEDELKNVFANDGTTLDNTHSLFTIKNSKTQLPKLRMHVPHFITIHPTSLLSFFRNSLYLKPVRGLLVCIKPDNSVMTPVACTLAGMRFYEKQIRELLQGDKYILLDLTGALIFKTAHCSLQEAQSAINSEIVTEAIALAGLLDGQVPSTRALADVVHKYKWTEKEYFGIHEHIREIHTSQNEIKSDHPKLYELLQKIAATPKNAARTQQALPMTKVTLLAEQGLFKYENPKSFRSLIDEERAWYDCYYQNGFTR